MGLKKQPVEWPFSFVAFFLVFNHHTLVSHLAAESEHAYYFPYSFLKLLQTMPRNANK